MFFTQTPPLSKIEMNYFESTRSTSSTPFYKINFITSKAKPVKPVFKNVTKVGGANRIEARSKLSLDAFQLKSHHDVIMTSISNSSKIEQEIKATTIEEVNYEVSNWRRINFYVGHYVFVYSAFFDDRIQPNVIRLNVVAPLRYIKSHGRTRCLIETTSGEFVTTFGRLEVLREHFSLPWASHFIFCDIADKTVSVSFTMIKTTL